MLNLFQNWQSSFALQQENPGFKNRLVTMLGRAFLWRVCMLRLLPTVQRHTSEGFFCHSKVCMGANVSVNMLLA